MDLNAGLDSNWRQMLVQKAQIVVWDYSNCMKHTMLPG